MKKSGSHLSLKKKGNNLWRGLVPTYLKKMGIMRVSSLDRGEYLLLSVEISLRTTLVFLLLFYFFFYTLFIRVVLLKFFFLIMLSYVKVISLRN